MSKFGGGISRGDIQWGDLLLIVQCTRGSWYNEFVWRTFNVVMGISMNVLVKSSLIVHLTKRRPSVNVYGRSLQPAARMRPSGEFCAAREGYFTTYNAL